MYQTGITDKELEEKEAFDLLSGIKPEYISKYLYKNREELSNQHKSSFSNEEELKTWFIKEFEQWFIVHKDVKGKGYVNQKEFNLEADFILEPKIDLIAKGIASYIGVEVKYINTKKEFLTQLNKLSFQALSYSYSNSKWFVNGEDVKTEAFIIFTNLSFSTEKNIFDTLDKYYYSWWTANLALINHANVGELRVNQYRNVLNSWNLYFAGNNYCKWSKETGIVLSNPKVIGKYRIGNIK